MLPIKRSHVTYIPKRGDIVTVSVPHQANTYEEQGIRYDIPYSVIKAENSQISHLQEVGGRKRVIAWNRDLHPEVSS